MKSLTIFLLTAIGSCLVGAQGVLKIESTHSESCTTRSKSGDVISVNYNGTLTDGKAFDSTYSGSTSKPFSFTIGHGDVIKGWELGLLYMCVGDRRTLTLSPEFGYGSRGVGPIPANSTLLFYTELVKIA
ncbi:FK506-binding protein [Thozetella sp. PMI_491]|nr:FK506-binding protein [Thozetella sp. PMI_491]